PGAGHCHNVAAGGAGGGLEIFSSAGREKERFVAFVDNHIGGGKLGSNGIGNVPQQIRPLPREGLVWSAAGPVRPPFGRNWRSGKLGRTTISRRWKMRFLLSTGKNNSLCRETFSERPRKRNPPGRAA